MVSAVYQPASGDVYTFSGTVTVNGIAIRPGMTDPTVAATVRATEVNGANQGNSVSVNPDGTFQMALFSGTYNISIDYRFGESWHGTWTNFGSRGYPGPQNLSISGDVSQNIDIPLQSLTGTVKDSDGNTVPDAELSYSGPYSYGSTTTSTEAGFEGAYKLYFLQGTYSLQVNPPAGSPLGTATVEVNIPGAAPAIELHKQPLLSGTVTVSGVTIQSGMADPVVTGTVRATEVNGANQGNSASLNPDGTYQMALLPGTYNISVDCSFDESWHGTWINFGSWGYPGPQNLSISADTSRNIDIPLQSLTGTVKDSGGNPVPDAELSYSGPHSLGSTTTSTEAGFEGTYKLYFLQGTYSLQVDPPAGSPLGTATVKVNIPGTAPAIELHKQPLLSGTVRVNGVAIQPGMADPMVSATVRATEVNGANQGNSATVNPDGTYQMALLPGTYNISVDYWSRESWHGAWITFGSWGYPGPQNLSISADATQDVDIALHSLTGTVKDSGGSPVPGAELSYSGPHSVGSATTSAEAGFEGTYKLYFLQGTYSMQVTPPAALFPPFQIKRIDIIEDSSRNIVLGYDRAVLDQALAMLSPHLELHLDAFDVMTAGSSNVYDFVVSAPRDLAQIIVNWADSEMQVSVYRPDGSLYGRYQPGTSPIRVDIQNPEVGTWTCEVTALNVPDDNCPVAVVAGLTPNQPPVANAGGPYSGIAGTPVVFDAGSSYDADGEIVLYEWDWDDDGIFDQSTTHPNITHTWDTEYDGTVHLRVTDNEGLIETGCASVEIADATLPLDVTISVHPDILWPPNHKMVPVVVDASVSNPEAVCHITSVSSNEPEDGLGDGHTAPDWKITGDLTADLRAERSGAGNGRIYTITVECAAPSGNTATATADVKVPHDRCKKKKHHDPCKKKHHDPCKKKKGIGHSDWGKIKKKCKK